MKALRLLLLFALTACQTPAIAPIASFRPTAERTVRPQAGSRTHLYAWVSSGTHDSIERFRLIGGIPAKNPDRVYPRYGGDVAVAGDGTLYVGDSTVTGEAVIYAFPPDSLRPKRVIIIPDLASQCQAAPGFTGENGIAADASGYLFVAIVTYSSGAGALKQTKAGPPSSSEWPCEGVAIYAPGAMGDARPAQVIRYGRGGDLTALAVDAADNLYVANSGRNNVDEFANPIVNPTLTRTFRSAYIGKVHALATDREGDIFIAGTDPFYQSGRITRFTPDAKGRGKPTSTIRLAPGAHLFGSLTESGKVLYVNDTYKSVDLYHAFRNGDQSPFYSAPLVKVWSLATGP